MPATIALVIESRTRDLGGFEVRRILPSARRQTIGPFIFFDHMGPARFEPGKGVDVRPHPHTCLATVTYLFEGELIHRDSLGVVQRIQPGDVNWMTAGSGIVHSERTDPKTRPQGPRLHGIQSWVALPQAAEEIEPSFRHYGANSLPVIELPGVWMRLIAGTAFGQASPVRTLSEMFYLDAHLNAASALSLPSEHQERGVYVADGEVSIAGEGFETGSLVVLDAGDEVTVSAESDSRLMLLGGEPLDGKRFIWWNFVASSKERIERAKADWREGRFEKVPGETEFIPLPDR
jgi:redox-sensitive bicupin YhaK (pirin superfamily)